MKHSGDKTVFSGLMPATVWGLTAFSIACSDTADLRRPVSVTEVDSGGVAIVTISGDPSSLPVWTLSDSPVLEISGDAAPYLGSIGEVEFLSDGSLLVEDSQTRELHLFDSAGTVKRLVGGAGSGPGEFQNLTEMTVTPGDTVFTYDRRLYRVSVFGPMGELVRTLTLTREDGGRSTLAMDVWALDSQHLLLHRLSAWDSLNAAPLPRRDQRDVVLFSLDSVGAVRGEPIRFPGGYSVEFEQGDAGSPFANEPIIAVGGGRIVHGSGLAYELTVSTPDLVPERIVRWGGWQKPLTEDVLNAVRGAFGVGWEELRAERPDLVESLMDALFSPNVLPELLPALGPVFLDESGRIWVSRFRPTTDLWNQEDSWHILDEGGRPLARVPLPPKARLAACRRDLVALIMRDSLDVESLRVFRLTQED
jgi:hypothetical protein